MLAEFFTLCPIFPGESEIDQLYKICCVLGSPDWTLFPEARSVSQLADISYSKIMPANLLNLIPNASFEAIDLINQLCSWDPLKRLTAEQYLQHPFFYVNTSIPRPLADPLQLEINNIGPHPNLELNLWDFCGKTDDCFLGLTLAVNPGVSDMEMTCQTGTRRQDLLFCPDYGDQAQHSVLWSMLQPDPHSIPAAMESSLSLTISTVPHSTPGVPQFVGLGVPSVQPNFFTMSSHFQQKGHCR